MQLERESIVEGKVTGILKFGAFVDLGEGKSGMVHISEVSNTYVDDINNFLKVGQTVKVKVLSISEDGKIALSIKKAEPAPYREKDFKGGRAERHGDYSGKDKEFTTYPKRQQPKKQPAKKEPPDIEAIQYAYEPRSTATNASFEDMLSRFKASSEDRMSDLKRNMDVRKKGSRRR